MTSNPEPLNLSIRVDGGQHIPTIKSEMAVLANRLGVTVHGEFNDEGFIACPGESVARVYMKRMHACRHAMVISKNGGRKCLHCDLETGPKNAAPPLDPDQETVVRNAVKAGLLCAPVFARAFGLEIDKVEELLSDFEAGDSVEKETADRIAEWIESNPHGNSSAESQLLAMDIRRGSWRE